MVKKQEALPDGFFVGKIEKKMTCEHKSTSKLTKWGIEGTKQKALK